jgi:hypothetical protein
MGVSAVSQIDELLRNQLRPKVRDSADEAAIWADVGQRIERRQRARRKRRVGALVCIIVVLVFAAGLGGYLEASTTSPISGSRAPRVFDPELGRGGFSVTPNTGLVNHQKVAISIHGLEPESTIWLVMCVGHPASVQQAETHCLAPAPPEAEMVDLNKQGAAHIRFTVDRYLAPGGYQIDCATYAGGCSVGLGNPLTFTSAHITGNIEPVTFKHTPASPANPLQTSVSPTAPFFDGQGVTLSGTGFPASSTVRVAECPTNTDCGSYFEDVDTSPEGNFSVPMTLHRTYTIEQGTASGGEEPVTINCGQPLRCFLVAQEDAPPYAAASSIPLVFVPPN